MEQRNLILAIVLSVSVLLGYQFLIEAPRLEKERALRETQKAQQTAQTTQPGSTAPSAAGAPPPATGTAPVAGRLATPPTVSRSAVVAAAPRVRISTGRLQGSINLAGAKIDDLALTNYRDTIKKDSGNIVLLSPSATEKPYFAQFGWVAQAQGQSVPGPDTVWKADRSTLSAGAPVTLTWTNPQGVEFSQVIAVDRDYMFTVTQRVRNASTAPVAVNSYGLVTLTGTPKTEGFWILHEGPLGVFDNTLKEISYDDVKDADNGIISQQTGGGWIGITAKYFATALIPDQKVANTSRFVHTAVDGKDKYQIDYLAPAASVAPGQTAEFTTRLFAGAKEVKLLDAYEEGLAIPRFDRLVDFGWFYFLTKPIFYVLDYFYRIIGNFGVAILLLTVIFKLAFFPLANKSYRSMSRLKKLQPKMMELKERHKDDRQKLNQAMMELYKKEGANPMSGCFPILIQIPVFFALYKVLFVTIEMRHAPFFGWIHDLSAPDPLGLLTAFGLVPWDVPHSLLVVNVGIWPLIMGVTMFLQQKLNPQPADAMQQKVFMLLPIVFTFLLGSFPAGLVIYWAWNNTLSITQQWIIMRQMGVSASGGTIEPEVPAGPRSKKDEADAAAKAAVPQGPGKGGSRRQRRKR